MKVIWKRFVQINFVLLALCAFVWWRYYNSSSVNFDAMYVNGLFNYGQYSNQKSYGSYFLDYKPDNKWLKPFYENNIPFAVVKAKVKSRSYVRGYPYMYGGKDFIQSKSDIDKNIDSFKKPNYLMLVLNISDISVDYLFYGHLKNYKLNPLERIKELTYDNSLFDLDSFIVLYKLNLHALGYDEENQIDTDIKADDVTGAYFVIYYDADKSWRLMRFVLSESEYHRLNGHFE